MSVVGHIVNVVPSGVLMDLVVGNFEFVDEALEGDRERQR